MRGSWRHVAVAAIIIVASVAGFVIARDAAERSASRRGGHEAEVAAIQVENAANRASAYVDSLRLFLVGPVAATQQSFDVFATKDVRASSRPPDR